jgi:hypothetical protein
MAEDHCPLAARLLTQVQEAHEALLARMDAGEAERRVLRGLFEVLAYGLAGLSEEHLLARPAPDEWSMAEVLEHIVEHDHRFAELERLGFGHYVEHNLEHGLQLWRLRPTVVPVGDMTDHHAAQGS